MIRIPADVRMSSRLFRRLFQERSNGLKIWNERKTKDKE